MSEVQFWHERGVVAGVGDDGAAGGRVLHGPAQLR